MNTAYSRRKFLRRSLMAALGSIGARGALGVLAAANASVARAAFADYKALVCVFLHGGNDGWNVLVPSDTRYQTYQSARGSLALPAAQLLRLSGQPYSIHPSLTELRALFDNQRLAFVANVGPLLAPTTKAAALAQNYLPPRLFSHNDQQDTWMSSEPGRGDGLGWAGRLADLFGTAYGSAQLSMNLSVAGNNILQVGRTTAPYVLSAGGSVPFYSIHESDYAAQRRGQVHRRLRELATEDSVYERFLSQLTDRAIEVGIEVNAALANAPAMNTVFPADNSLASQLQLVAKLISARRSLSVNRQVFFVSLGGFDTHDNQLVNQAAQLKRVSQAMSAFNTATVELGLGNNVTTFTASEFGRTLTSNGDGSDHAWGNVHWVLGGAVRGGAIYGQFPDQRLNGPDDMNNGRLIPTTSVEEYAAPLLRWFGAAQSEVDTVFPHLSRFATRGLEYL